MNSINDFKYFSRILYFNPYLQGIITFKFYMRKNKLRKFLFNPSIFYKKNSRKIWKNSCVKTKWILREVIGLIDGWAHKTIWYSLSLSLSLSLWFAPFMSLASLKWLAEENICHGGVTNSWVLFALCQKILFFGTEKSGKKRENKKNELEWDVWEVEGRMLLLRLVAIL